MVTEIHLFGSLGRRWGRKWKLDVHTPAEAVNAINHLRPGFADAILRMRDVDFGVKVGKRQIGAKMLTFPAGGKRITITPVARGSASSKGWIEVVAGVVLIAAGFVFPAIAPFTIGLGLSLVLGGVASLLSATPTTQSPSNAQKPSYQFSSIINSVGEGECVPVLYGGPLWIGSYVVSAGYENIDITSGSTSQNTTSSGGTGTAAMPLLARRALA